MNRSSSLLHPRLLAFARARGALLLAALWGFAEATLFFIVPDVLLALVALLDWRRAGATTASALAGALVGGAVMVGLGARDIGAVRPVLDAIPLVSPAMIEATAQQYADEGLMALVTGPWQGIPYKVFAAEAGAAGLPLLPFLLLSIPARLIRYLPAVLAAALIGARLRRRIEQHPARAMGIYVALWVAIYYVIARYIVW